MHACAVLSAYEQCRATQSSLNLHVIIQCLVTKCTVYLMQNKLHGVCMARDVLMCCVCSFLQ
jgi:hypothetical protein